MTAILHYKFPYLIGCWLLFSIILSVFLLRDVIFNPGLPYTRDLIFPQDLSTLNHFLGSWDDIHSQYNPELNKLPLYLSLLFVSSFLGSEWTVKLLFLVVVFLVTFIPFVSIYILFKDKVQSSKKLAFICSVPSLFYLFNPWVVDRISNHIYLVFGMAFTPLILVLFIRLIEKKAKPARALLNGTVLALILTIASFSTHNVLYLIPLLLIVSLYYLITMQKSQRGWVIVSSTVFFMIYIGLNSYWIMPNSLTIMTAKPSYDFSIAEIERLSKLNTPSNSIQMYGGGGWRDVIMIPPNNLPSLGLYSLIPIFALSAILLFPMNKLVLFLGILFILIFPLTLGTNSPIPIYDWLIGGPLGGIVWLFRDPFRLVQFTVMIFSMLLAFTIHRIMQLRKNIFILIMIFAILYSPAAYTFFNAAGNRLISSELPSEYEEVKAFLQSDNGNYKTLWLPLRQYQYYDWNKVNGEVAGDVYSASSPVPTFGLSTSSSSLKFWTYIYSNILLDYRTNDLGKILSTYDVKYVVVHEDLLGSQENEAEKVIKILTLQRDVILIKQTGKYNIFLNLDYRDDTNNVSAYPTESYEQFRSSLLLSSSNLMLDTFDIAKWNPSPLNQISVANFDGNTSVKWDIKFSKSQERYEIKMPLNNANFENYDRLNVQVLPLGAQDPRILGVTLYTNSSNFQFTRYDLIKGQWNNMVFDLRAPKIDQAAVSRDLNLRNVTAIGFVAFGKYYPLQTDYTFYISRISLVPDPNLRDTVALLDNWPTPQNSDMLKPVKSEYGRTYVKLSATEPTMLTLHESYDPNWKATVRNGENVVQLDSVPTFGILNGFMIPGPGEYEIEVYYATQGWVYYGFVITGLTAILVVFCLIKYRNRDNTKQSKPNSISEDEIKMKSSGLLDGPRYFLRKPRDLLFFSANVPQLAAQRFSDCLIIIALSLLIVLPISAIFQVGPTADIVTTFSFFLLAAGLVLRAVILIRTLPFLDMMMKELKLS